MNIAVLGSTSYGNSTVIWDNEDAIMVDCGFSQRYTYNKFEEIGVEISALSGVLITHSHSDHIKQTMVKRLFREKVDIFCHPALNENLHKQYSVYKRIKNYGVSDFTIGKFTIRAFEVDHDSPGGCFGYNIIKDNKKITVATDLGKVDSYLINNFQDSDLIIIESNYDIQMLKQSSRSQVLKDRIVNTHLSNQETANFIKDVLNCSSTIPKAIIASHISQECNTNNIVIKELSNVLKEKYPDIKLEMTHKTEISNIVTV